jgi:hypothetical protein
LYSCYLSLEVQALRIEDLSQQMKLLAAGWDDIIELASAAKRPADPGSHFGRIYPGIEAAQD